MIQIHWKNENENENENEKRDNKKKQEIHEDLLYGMVWYGMVFNNIHGR